MEGNHQVSLPIVNGVSSVRTYVHAFGKKKIIFEFDVKQCS
jgi:hypothetical protein